MQTGRVIEGLDWGASHLLSGSVVARSTRSCAAAVCRCGQRAHDLPMLSHAEIVIRAPNCDLRNGSVRPAPFGGWEAAGDAFDVGEDTITPLPVQALKRVVEMTFVRFGRTIVIVRSERPVGRRQRSLPRHDIRTQMSITDASVRRMPCLPPCQYVQIVHLNLP
jgi:hypothetical protein